MPELKPVPGQVIVKQDHLNKLSITAGEHGVPSNPTVSRGKIVRAILAELNQQRCGDPAGVIRRSDKGSIAIRDQHDDGSLYWNVLRLEAGDPEAPTPDDIMRWTPTHTESWWYRLTDTDYGVDGDEP